MRPEHDTPLEAALQQMHAARLFQGLDETALRTVLQNAQLLHAPAGTVLAHEGDDES